MKKEFKKGFTDILKGMQMSNNDINEFRGGSVPSQPYLPPDGECSQCYVCSVCFNCYCCSSCSSNSR